MEFKGIYKRSKVKSSIPDLHHFAISTDYPDINRFENGLVPAEGYLFPLPEDTEIHVKGYWDNEHAIFRAEEIIPDTGNRRLSLNLIKSIIKEQKKGLKFSQAIPRQILEVTGDDILKYAKLHENADEIKKALPKIDEIKIDTIYRRIRESVSSYETVPYLTKLGISAISASKLAVKYGPHAITRVKKHPFLSGKEIGLSFYDCDLIAKAEKLDPLLKERISAMAAEALSNMAESTGSTYATFPELSEWMKGIVRKSSYPEDEIPPAFLYLLLDQDKKFFLQKLETELRVCLRYYRTIETKAVKHLKRLNVSKKNKNYDESLISELETIFSIKYGDAQKEALRMAASSGIKIITGGPGTGKTTTIRGFIELYSRINPKKKISLCAPTGRAAQRMSDVIKGMKALTVHKLLDIRLFETAVICKNEDNPLMSDLIIVDEISMLDIELLSTLLAAIKTGSTVVFVGDEDQLKSVGPGNVLHDLLESEKFDTVRLNKGYRQDSESLIIKNAHKIKNGETVLEVGDDFEIENFRNEKDAQARIVTLFKENYTAKAPMLLQVLSDVKKTELGTMILNHRIKQELIKGRTDIPEGQRISVGDKVIFMRNNYNEGYYNGDMGIVTNLFPQMMQVAVNGQIIEVNRENMQDIQLAYGITIHKSQGSECNTVIIALPEKPKNMLTRNLLYTAVTRAKEKVIIVSVNKAVQTAIKQAPLNKVKTNFNELLKAMSTTTTEVVGV